MDNQDKTGNVCQLNYCSLHLILPFQFFIIGGGTGLGWFRLGQGKAEAPQLGDEFQAGGDRFGRHVNFHPYPPLTFEYPRDPARCLSKTSLD